jgi:glycosyltransferase involved in cell wall biosynthesis
MEAMATGRYCLSHHWDGAEELLPEENLFYTDGALKALVLTFDAMSAADKDRESARLRDRVRERFDVDRTKVRIRQVIEEAAAAARAA